ncbi:BLOC-1-related complex subunit 7 isoform X1 [Chironomus tepperi]|uniref:BLOC-1-related complex subunit 7 isoform X1 n=1 Tax=Chironomus tepperi TaxID=113505 RepID=UPI00391F7DA5
MSIASRDHAKQLFNESKRRLADRVGVNVNNTASIARQIVRGSKSNDILMQSAKHLAQQETALENTASNLNKIQLIQQQLGYQHAAIREGCHILGNVREAVSTYRP